MLTNNLFKYKFTTVYILKNMKNYSLCSDKKKFINFYHISKITLISNIVLSITKPIYLLDLL